MHKNVYNIDWKPENVEQQLPYFVITDPTPSDSDFDIDEQDRFLEEQATLQKEKEEEKKTLARMVKALVPPPVEDDALIDEEIRRLREEFDESYHVLKRDLSKSLPAALMLSGQSSPNTVTTAV